MGRPPIANSSLSRNDDTASFRIVKSPATASWLAKAKAIAVTSTQRMAETPDLPTVSEAGLPGYKWIFWYGLLAPAKTPRAVLDKINADLVAVLRQPEVRQRFGPLGIEPATNTPEEMDKLIADEVLNFKKLAAAAQIQLD